MSHPLHDLMLASPSSRVCGTFLRMKKLVAVLAASAFSLSLYSAAIACPGHEEGKAEASSTFAKKDSKKATTAKTAKVVKKSPKKVVKAKPKAKAKAKPTKVSAR